MKNYAVLFDMDGVIAHTNPYHAKAFEAFFDSYAIPHSQEEFEKHMFGKHNSYIMSHFFNRPIGGDELLKLEDEKESKFREIYRDQIKAIDGYELFLTSLKKAGFKTGVGTSAPRANMDLIIDGLHIRQHLNSLMASENVTRHKPDPQVYLLSAQQLGVAPSQCVVFEDSFSGVSAAINAGMKVVGVLSSHTREQLPPCDLYITDYYDISVQDIIGLLER